MSRVTTYAYDLSGNIVEKGLANGLTEVRSHDGRNRVSTLHNQRGEGTDMAGYDYQYDAVGNVMAVVEDYAGEELAGRSITNQYDGVYRLIQEEIATEGGDTVTTGYSYDLGHNRTGKTVSGEGSITYTIGNGSNGAGANQIIGWVQEAGEPTTYKYDPNGNRSQRTAATLGVLTTGDTEADTYLLTHLGAGSSGIVPGMLVQGVGIPVGTTVESVLSPTMVVLSQEATGTYVHGTLYFSFLHTDLYGYDDENRLIGAQTAGGDAYAYAYDYRTRRVSRLEPGEVMTRVVFDGGSSITEYEAGALTVEYVRGHDDGGGVGGLEYSLRRGSARYNLYNSRGDVTGQTNDTGIETFLAAYEAFGTQTVTDGSSPDRQKANTKEQDPTGLLNEGFRYRDPETGTFLTRDPLGLKAGPNMYTYVRQNPWTHFDPEGLDSNPPPPPPPPSQHAPPPKQTTPQNSIGAGGWHKDVTVGPADSSTSNSTGAGGWHKDVTVGPASGTPNSGSPTDSARSTGDRIKQGLEGVGALAGAVTLGAAMVPAAGSTVVDGPVGIGAASLAGLGAAASFTYGMANLGAAFSPNTPKANATAAKVEAMPSSFNQLVGAAIAGKPGQNVGKGADFAAGIVTGGADIIKATTVRQSATAAVGYATTVIDGANQVRSTEPTTQTQRP